MIANFFYNLATTAINDLASAINTAWHDIDFGPIASALNWLRSVEFGLPVPVLGIVATFCTLAAVTVVIKFGIKLIDWIRG